MLPIVVSTLGSQSLKVLKASIETYAPDCQLIVHYGSKGNFGLDYNDALDRAFGFYGHTEVLMANDDIVLDPDTMPTFMEDLTMLKSQFDKLGLVATRSNFVRQIQNVRYDQYVGRTIKVNAVSPLLAYISKDAFSQVRFGPLNWYSDDVMCADLEALGYSHFVSRAYVHHAGSLTVRRDAQKLTDEARPWIEANRPQLARQWFGAAHA